MARTIKEYKQRTDGRWYAGEVKPELIGVGASKAADYLPTDTSKGVCFGLSIWWIIKSANKADFWTWMHGAGPHVADIKSLFLAQKGEYEFTRFEAAEKKITSETQLKRKCEILMNQGMDLDLPGYHYLSLRGKFHGTTDSGHALAAHVNPKGACRYFDPNLGEFETDDASELATALGQLVKAYNIADLKSYWCCWG